MEHIENPWLARGEREVDFDMYCHNPRCVSFNQVQLVPGIVERDTGGGEPDWLECRDCQEMLAAWPCKEPDE